MRTKNIRTMARCTDDVGRDLKMACKGILWMTGDDGEVPYMSNAAIPDDPSKNAINAV